MNTKHNTPGNKRAKALTLPELHRKPPPRSASIFVFSERSPVTAQYEAERIAQCCKLARKK